MTRTFNLVRDNIDPDEWRIVTDGKYVWGVLHSDFFSNGATPHLEEEAAENATESIECVIMTKTHYDVLMEGSE